MPAAAPYASNLQFTLDLVEEAPVSEACDDLVGRLLDHADFIQSEGEKTDRVLGVAIPPEPKARAQEYSASR